MLPALPPATGGPIDVARAAGDREPGRADLRTGEANAAGGVPPRRSGCSGWPRPASAPSSRSRGGRRSRWWPCRSSGGGRPTDTALVLLILGMGSGSPASSPRSTSSRSGPLGTAHGPGTPPRHDPLYRPRWRTTDRTARRQAGHRHRPRRSSRGALLLSGLSADGGYGTVVLLPGGGLTAAGVLIGAMSRGRAAGRRPPLRAHHRARAQRGASCPLHHRHKPDRRRCPGGAVPSTPPADRGVAAAFRAAAAIALAGTLLAVAAMRRTDVAPARPSVGGARAGSFAHKGWRGLVDDQRMSRRPRD
jgi:hypothetical protein